MRNKDQAVPHDILSLSSRQKPSFFVTGGTLHRDAPCYIMRDADDRLYEALDGGQYCYVLTARQMGKSSLMIRTATRLHKAGTDIAVLDLTAIGQNLTAEHWYDGLLGRIGRQLRIEDELDEYWVNNPRKGPLQRWMNAITEVVLPRCSDGLVIFVDEIDTVRSLPFSTDEFFAGIREFYNRRTENPELERLVFCLLGVAAPSDLISDTRMTPFNIGRRIELYDFTTEEAAPLAKGLGGDDKAGGILLKRVLYWTNGHPYLTQRLCLAIADDPSVCGPNGVDRKCAELFFEQGAQICDDNLLFVRERMLRSEVELAGLLTLYDQVLQEKKVENDETNPLVTVLGLSGIVRTEKNHLKVRNRIYERSFDREWVKENMPDAELRRQRAAYRKGLLRAASVAALILTVIGALGFAAIRGQQHAIAQQKIAEQQRTEARQQRSEAQQQRNRADANAKRLAISLNDTELQRQQAVNLQMIAEEQRMLAENQKDINYQQLYTAQMNLAGQAWEQSNVERMNELLNLHLPQPGRKDMRGFEWFLLHRLGHNDLPVVRHENVVIQVFFTPDGRKLISAGLDGAKLSDIATGRELAVFKGHTDTSWAADLSRDGKILVTGSSDKTAKLWDVTTGKELLTLKEQHPVYLAAISPDGKTLATVASYRGRPTRDWSIRLWEVSNGNASATLQGHKKWPFEIAFSPDGKQLATASHDGTVVLWEVASGKKLHTFGKENTAPGLPFIRVAFSPDGRRLATNNFDGTSRTSMNVVRVWDRVTGKEIFALQGHEQSLISLVFAPDGKRLLTADWTGVTKLWDAATGKELLTLKGLRSRVTYATFSLDGGKLATSSADQATRLWDVVTGHELATLKGHSNFTNGLAFSPDGRLLATASGDKTARLWDVGTGMKPFTINGSVTSLAFSSDSRKLAIGGPDGTIRLWDVAAGKELLAFKGHARLVENLAFSPDDTMIGTASHDGTARLWEVATGKQLVTLRGHTHEVMQIVFTPDGKRVVTTGLDTTHRLWDAETGKQLARFTGHKPGVNVQALSISPDGRMLATGSDDRTTKLWELDSGRELFTLNGDNAMIYAVAFSPDGRRLATAGDNKLIKLWDIATRREIMTLKGHSNNIASLSFSPDGRRLATGSGDSTAKLWDVATGQELLTLREYQGPVRVAFSPDGSMLATGSIQDQKTKLWLITRPEVAAARQRTAQPRRQAAQR